MGRATQPLLITVRDALASRTAAATGGSVTFMRPKQTRNAASLPFVSVEVALVQWPAEQDRREELRRAGQPRLLLVERGAPPIPTDELEDWIRLPADDLDLRVRVEALRRRTDSDAGLVPVLDDDGVLRLGDRWVSLPPVEARLTRALLDRFGAVVSREALARSGWPGGSPGRNALDVHVLRLRRRLSPLRLAIRTVRSRGYLLERSDGGGQVAPDPGRPTHTNGVRRISVG
jgi:two-component system OmpR family response regulator